MMFCQHKTLSGWNLSPDKGVLQQGRRERAILEFWPVSQWSPVRPPHRQQHHRGELFFPRLLWILSPEAAIEEQGGVHNHLHAGRQWPADDDRRRTTPYLLQ